MSPSTEKYDRQIKARRLAALKVPHYWVPDPDLRRLDCYHNVDGTFVQSATEADAERLLSPDFEGLTIDLAAIWR